MGTFEVYSYNLPKVSADGKQLLSPGNHEIKAFSARGEATSFAKGKKDSFERVVVIEVNEGAQVLVERYSEGKHELRENIVRR